MSNSCIVTYTGKFIDPLNLKPEDVDIRDIAHALSNLCRYGGHTRHFYSVAQHSVILADEVRHRLGDEQAFFALLHDAEEAYVVDLPRPLKNTMQLAHYQTICQKVSVAIFKRFDVDLPLGDYVTVMNLDKEMVLHEANRIMEKPLEWRRQELDAIQPTFSPIIEFMTPHRAEHLFLETFGKLCFALDKHV